ncbi:MAG: ABC transporter permease [Promethearchaeota archaeon]
MTEQIINDDVVYNEAETQSKKKYKRLLKFYLIPGWRDDQFTNQEYEIEKIKSKRKLFRRLLTPLTIFGLLMLLFLALLAVYAPWLTEYKLQEITLPFLPKGGKPFSPPSALHPLGTTEYGYDILARIIWGARTTLFIGLFPVTISIGVGTILGTISAYFGGPIDYVIMRFVDLMYSIPMLILVIILIPIMGQDLLTSLILFGILYIPYNIRFMRSLVLQVKQLIYVRAARTSGALKFRVMFKHIIPNAISPIIINFFGGAAFSILGMAGLAFIGMGDPNVASWGIDINWARGSFTTFIAAFWPGLFLGISTIAFMLIGDGLRDAIDPRLHI